MTRTPLHRSCALVLLTAVMFLSGCGSGNSELVAVESEKEANRILVELQQRGIISATVERTTVNRKPVNTISVAPADLDRSRQILVQLDLPRENRGGMEAMVNSGGLIPTKSDERAKLMYALSQELERTLETYDRVVRARVHVVIPEEDWSLRANPDAAPKPSATVVIKYVIPSMPSLSEDATAEERAKAAEIAKLNALPPVEEMQVQSIVARSVQGMDEQNVFVTFTSTRVEATLAAAAATQAEIAGSNTGQSPVKPKTGFASVWEDPMKLQLFGAVVLLGALCIFLIVKLVKKGKRPAPATP